MWLFAKQGFVSVVVDQDDPDLLLVRGRFRGDVQAVLGVSSSNRVLETRDSDYRFRAWTTHRAFTARLVELVDAIDYTNFKNAAPPERHVPYLRVWSVMMDEQQRRYEGPPKKRKRKKRRIDPDAWAGLPLQGDMK